MMTLDLTDPHQLNEVAENDIERMHAEEMQPQHALLTLANGLPAIGIVAAVLGVIKTMGSIDQPTNVLGARSEEHPSELQSLMRISYAVFGLKHKKTIIDTDQNLASHT